MKYLPPTRKFLTVMLSVLFPLLGIILIYLYWRSGPKLPPETDAIIDEVMNHELPELITGETGFALSDGLNIWYERITPEGTAKGTVLLLMSNGGDALFWPPKFMQAFLTAGYEVIRYDHRGTGMSDWVDNWDRKNPYTIADMAGDATAVLDKLQVQQAHLVGMSLGGMVAQEVAINYLDKVETLTLIMTTGYMGDPELPGMSSRYLVESTLKGLPLLKYRLMGGERNLIKEHIAKYISFLGYEGLDIKETAEMVLYSLRKRRGVNLKGVFQHLTAVTISGSRYEKLRHVNIPTLVIHGTEDPIIPVAHGKKLVEVMPHASGIWVEGLGHGFPLPQALTDDILAHLARQRSEMR